MRSGIYQSTRLIVLLQVDSFVEDIDLVCRPPLLGILKLLQSSWNVKTSRSQKAPVKPSAREFRGITFSNPQQHCIVMRAIVMLRRWWLVKALLYNQSSERPQRLLLRFAEMAEVTCGIAILNDCTLHSVRWA